MFSVRGYHVHKDKWEASVGEELSCQRERGNLVDSFAISVVKDGDVVGNLPQKISSICFTFLRNGMVTCQVTGSMRYSTNLPQGELEVPCILVFRWDAKRMDEARRILEFALASNKEDMNPSKKRKLQDLAEETNHVPEPNPEAVWCDEEGLHF